MKVMTLTQVLADIRKMDPATALNENLLSVLIKEKRLPYGSRGNRVILEVGVLINALNDLFGFSGETFVPKVRTVRSAAIELKESHYGMSERHIRQCIIDGKLKTIKIGNRHYVAMQSFSSPYSESLIYGITEKLAKIEHIKNDMQKQMDNLISSQSCPPTVVRMHKR